MATTNIGLTTLTSSEKIKTFPTTFNNDMTTIDTVFGNGISTSRTVTQAITSAEEGLAIVANGNNHAAVSAGQYVYVKNHGSLSEGIYTATSAISQNATLSLSNLSKATSGGLNSVRSSITNLGGYFAVVSKSQSSQMTSSFVISYPTGFNATNSFIVGYMVYENGQWYSNGGIRTLYTVSNGVNVTPETSGWTITQVRILLCKFA